MIINFRYIRGEKNQKGRCEEVFKRQKYGDTIKEEIVDLLEFGTFKVNDKKKNVLMFLIK